MLARLHVHGGAKTKQLDLTLPTILGRGGSSKVKLPASTVSRQHCEIYVYEGLVAVRDLGSSNGTLVNGHRIDGPTFVGPEDLVQVGPLRFTVEPVAAKQTTSAPSPVVEPTAGGNLMAGDSVAGDSVAGDSVAGDSVAANPVERGSETDHQAGFVPTFDELPRSIDQPVQAETAPVVQESAAADVPAEANNSQESDDSVLQYSAAKDDGDRSFVGIDTGDGISNPSESEVSTPIVADAEEGPSVEADESALQNFFKHLGE